MLQQTRIALAIAFASVTLSCACGGPSTFVLNSAMVDATYRCPVGTSNSAYDLHATINVQNGTSSTVTIRSVAAAMTLVAVKGTWLEAVGDRYDATNVTFTPSTVPGGGSETLYVTIASACTNGKTPAAGSSYGEYSVALTVATSAGTHTIKSTNRHRIVPA